MGYELHYRVYVLQNSFGKRYIGLSADPLLRLEQHNRGVSRWTRGKGPWTMLWQSQATDLSQARKLENQLKLQHGGTGFFRITGLPLPSGS